MRRGIHGGGMGRGLGMNHNMMSLASGPGSFLNDQFSGLQDIDMQLELLKRKREIIEQQQKMLEMRNDYDYSMGNQSEKNRFNEFSRMYEEKRPYLEGRPGAGRKRVSVWEHEPQPLAKRAPPAPGPPPAAFRPRRPRPPPPPRKPFAPTKVTKPSAAPPFSRLAGKPPAQLRHLVSEAAGLTKAVPFPHAANVLREDVEPSRQVTGRLELALGSIFKDLKTAYPEHEDAFKKTRVIKQAIRERIRRVMMGKVVGNAEDIKTMYRETFPKETDHDILLKALEAYSSTEFIPTDAEDPEVYFFRNVSRLMSNKLDEMFRKLHDIYRVKKEEGSQSQKEELEKIGDEKPGVEKLGVEKPGVENTENPGDEKTETPGVQKTEKPGDQTSDGATNKAINKNKKPAIEITEAQQKVVNEIISTETYQALDRLMSIKLVRMLKNYIPAITKLMNLDGQYNRIMTCIKNEMKQKMMNLERKAGQNGQTPASNEEPTIEERPRYPPLPYVVKIMGRPNLPKRKVMQTFFEKFKPQMIKKHRQIHNLLFVGFSSKETYDQILAADGTTMGRINLSIKASNQNKNNDSQTENTEDKAEAPIDVDAEHNLIGAQLDEQIDDLLSSIRRSEELGETINLDDDEKTTNNGDNTEENTKQDESGATDVELVETTENEEVLTIDDDNQPAEKPANEDVELVEDIAVQPHEEMPVENQQEPITESEGQVSENNGKVTENGGQVTENEGQVTESEGNVTESEGQVTESEEQVTENNGKVTENDGLVTEIKEDPKQDTTKENNQELVQGDENNAGKELASENADVVTTLRGTPARGRVATPRAVRTRRSSRLQ